MDWASTRGVKFDQADISVGLNGDQSREAVDRLAIERGEDDGMIIRQDLTARAHNRRDINVITAR